MAGELGDGFAGSAIRLDSGDRERHARGARAMIDAAGLASVQIIASGGLDEHSIAALVAAGAKRCGPAAEVGERSDVVVTIVSDTPDVEAVLFGRSGLAGGLKPASVVSHIGTIAPPPTRRAARRLVRLPA